MLHYSNNVFLRILSASRERESPVKISHNPFETGDLRPPLAGTE